MAVKFYYLRKMGYMGGNISPIDAALSNENRSGSYHPWCPEVIGESFGESGLEKYISIKDYMNTTCTFDRVLKGVVTGAKKLAEKQADVAAKKAALLKTASSDLSKITDTIINVGDNNG